MLDCAVMSRLCCSRYERLARQAGWVCIAGLDEAGRGALFGPGVAAAAIPDPKRVIRGLDDSKKLSPERRAELAPLIHERAVAWAVAQVEASRIDAWNILQASRQAMTLAIARLAVAPDYLLLDAVTLDLPLPQKSLIHGDARSVSIAAASILAKVARDEILEQLDSSFPQYNLRSNKGYGTPDHLEALRLFGPTPLHRFSFAPVREASSWTWKASQQDLPLGGVGAEG